MQHGLRAVHHARSLKAPPPSKERPVLYTHTCCPYAQRALMGLLHKVRGGAASVLACRCCACAQRAAGWLLHKSVWVQRLQACWC